MTAGEHQDSNQTDSCPEVSVLDQRKQVWSRNTNECYAAQNERCDRCSFDVVEGPMNLWLGAFRKLASYPTVDELGGQSTMVCQYL